MILINIIKVIHEIYNRISLFLTCEKNISEEIKKITNTRTNNDDKKFQEQGVVYEIRCNECDLKYIGKTGRQLSVRITKH